MRNDILQPCSKIRKESHKFNSVWWCRLEKFIPINNINNRRSVCHRFHFISSGRVNNVMQLSKIRVNIKFTMYRPPVFRNCSLRWFRSYPNRNDSLEIINEMNSLSIIKLFPVWIQRFTFYTAKSKVDQRLTHII